MKPSPFDVFSQEEVKRIQKLTPEDIKRMSYGEFVALIKEVNKAPGGIKALLELIRLMDINESDTVLDVGCNTGYITFEVALLTKAKKIYGLDIMPEMIKTANNIKSLYPKDIQERVEFVVGDARHTDFPDNFFTKILIGGSMAFIENREKAIKEMLRILKPWGLVGDLEFYYKEEPPRCLLKELNKVLNPEGVFGNIEVWDYDWWIRLYEESGFEVIYDKKLGLKMKRSKKEIEEYCRKMIDRVPFSEKAREIAYEKLLNYMMLFNENNKYLDGMIIIVRKRTFANQVYLFYK